MKSSSSSPSSFNRLHNHSSTASSSNSRTSNTTTSTKVTTPNKNYNSVRLRSPKGTCTVTGSPITKKNRSHRLSSLSSLFRWVRWERLRRIFLLLKQKSLPSSFLVFLFILIPIAWTTIQRMTATINLYASSDRNHYYTAKTATTTASSSSSSASLLSPDLQSFDPTLYPVIPKSIYQPKSSNPIQVIYIGRLIRPPTSTTTSSSSTSNDVNDNNGNMEEENMEHDFDELLYALQRSSYTEVIASYLYSTNNITHPQHLLYQYQPTDGVVVVDSQQPLAIIVDWSTSSLRDCHVVRRIIHYIVQQLNKQQPNIQEHLVCMLLLDSSPVTTATDVVCSNDNTAWLSQQQQQQQLIPNIKNNNIRIAKRSIIQNRRYNYTKQWIESGSFITNHPTIHNKIDNNNKDNQVLYWSGFVSQSFVYLLGIVMNNNNNDDEVTKGKSQIENVFNLHNRPIDVSHYWKSATQSLLYDEQQYQYYYNRLRKIVQQQVNTTSQSILQMQSHDSYKPNTNNDDDETKEETADSNHALLSQQWVEFVGIDTEVTKFVKKSSESSSTGSSNDLHHHTTTGSSHNNDDAEGDDEDTDSIAAALKRASVHVAVLASSKIVIVTQSDEYEHSDSRLMEALASGALVLCDTMIGPPFGLIHKTNIVFFDSTTKLDEYLRYYLDPMNDEKRQEIARHGVEYALGRHRSWHTIEALLFGKALTRTDQHPLLDVGTKLKQSTAPTIISL